MHRCDHIPVTTDSEFTSALSSCTLRLKRRHSNRDLRDRTLHVDDVHCLDTFCETSHDLCTERLPKDLQ